MPAISLYYYYIIITSFVDCLLFRINVFPPVLACNLSLIYVVFVHNVITSIYAVLCL
jgi:hypothetical protein